MDLIPLKEVLAAMETGNPFSIRFVTADRKKKTGGKIIEVPEARLSKTVAQAPTTHKEKAAATKAPAHYRNCTRNILITSSNQIRKVHIRLITRFNNLQVIY